MYKNQKILSLIPARGGSKGLPGKNIRLLLGKPLIAWSIEQAKNSKYIDRIVVDTDDIKIAKVAKKYGAEVPFLEPKKLPHNLPRIIGSILYFLNRLEQPKKNFDYLVLLEPTSPLREVKDIDTPIEILLNKPEAKAIVGIAKPESAHPEFNVVLNKKGFIRKWFSKSNDFRTLRRQELRDVYFFEGSIYISNIKILKQEKSFYHKKTLGYVVPRYKSLEIDDIYDFLMVEAILKYKLKGKL